MNIVTIILKSNPIKFTEENPKADWTIFTPKTLPIKSSFENNIISRVSVFINRGDTLEINFAIKSIAIVSPKNSKNQKEPIFLLNI